MKEMDEYHGLHIHTTYWLLASYKIIVLTECRRKSADFFKEKKWEEKKTTVFIVCSAYPFLGLSMFG